MRRRCAPVPADCFGFVGDEVVAPVDQQLLPKRSRNRA